MKSKKLSVIIPVYKAESFIRVNLEKIKSSIGKHFRKFEIIAVIDGDLDKSYDEAIKVKGIKVLIYQHNRGKGFALKYGFAHCTGDLVTFVDCDMDIDPLQLLNLTPYLSSSDMVVGSKRHPFSRMQYPLKRRILSKGFQFYSWLVLQTHLRDTQSGLKLMKREMLEVIMPLILVKKYAFDLELCFLAQKFGFKVVEAPLEINYKFAGSGINPMQIYHMFLDVLAIRYRYSILRYYQKQFWRNK